MFTLIRMLLIAAVLCLALLVGTALYAVPYLTIAVALCVLWRAYRGTPRSSAHGTARWATPSDIPHLLEGTGLIVGHLDGRPSWLSGLRSLLSPRVTSARACRTFLGAFGWRRTRQVVRLTQAVHTAVFAPTGVGKGVSCVIPFALTCPDSMVIYDVKGEIALLTAKARRAMGHRVVVIDPYKVTTQEPDTFNPLAFIDKDSETALDDIRDLASALVVRSPQDKEPHWADSAEVWIAAMIATTVCFAEGDDKTLQSVRLLLTNPERMQAAIKLMCESDAMDGMLARLGYQLGQFKDKELGSTLTTTNRFLRFLDTTAIADSTAASSFNPADLLTKKVTVYLVMPPDRMRAQSALVRMWLSSLLRAVVKGGLQTTTKVQFVIDEAASLGHMECLDDAVDKLRGYGVRLLLIFQSLAQLRRVFPDGQDQTLLANVVQVFFGVNDHQTAEYVSSRLGESTILTTSGGTSYGTSQQTAERGQTSHTSSSNHSSNWSFMGRRLLRPEEVTALPDRVAITFAPGLPPIATRLIRYYENDFKRRREMGPIRAAFEAACLLVPTSLLVLILTAAVLNHTNQGSTHVQRNPAILQPAQKRNPALTR